MFAGFEADLAAAIATGRIAGAVALVANREGVVFEAAAGLKAVGNDAKVLPDSIFWLASMTKAITSVAALQLVETGKVGLDDDLAPLVPEFAEPQVLEGFDAGGSARLRPARSKITLRGLLTHTSGSGYGFLSPDLQRWADQAGLSMNSGTRKDMVMPLLFDPGQDWAYGIGIDWAGLVVEALSGQRLDAYFQDNILGPLGMIDTGFALSDDQEARRVSPHVRLPDGALMAIPFAMPKDPEVLSGGGGLYGTAADYSRFLRMVLNGGELDGVRILSPAMMAQLGDIQTGDLRAGAFKSTGTMTLDFDLFPEQRPGWGLATLVNPDPVAQGRAAGSLAWAGIFNTYYWADPTSGTAGILLAQLTPFGDPDILGLLNSLERAAYS